MNDIHSCSYYCDRSECIKAQRDELRARIEELERDVARVRKALRAVVVNPAIINLPSDYSPETAEIFSIIESTMREGK